MLKRENLIYSLIGLNIILFMGLIFYQPPPTVEAAPVCVPAVIIPPAISLVNRGDQTTNIGPHRFCALQKVLMEHDDEEISGDQLCEVFQSGNDWFLHAKEQQDRRAHLTCAAICIDL